MFSFTASQFLLHHREAFSVLPIAHFNTGQCGTLKVPVYYITTLWLLCAPQILAIT